VLVSCHCEGVGAFLPSFRAHSRGACRTGQVQRSAPRLAKRPFLTCFFVAWCARTAPSSASRERPKGNFTFGPELVQYFLYAWSGNSNAKCLQARHLPIPALSGDTAANLQQRMVAIARTCCGESTAAHASLRANVLHRRTQPLRGSARTARAAVVAKSQCVSLTGPWCAGEAMVPYAVLCPTYETKSHMSIPGRRSALARIAHGR
jgi:hypothetical protein